MCFVIFNYRILILSPVEYLVGFQDHLIFLVDLDSFFTYLKKCNYLNCSYLNPWKVINQNI